MRRRITIAIAFSLCGCTGLISGPMAGPHHPGGGPGGSDGGTSGSADGGGGGGGGGGDGGGGGSTDAGGGGPYDAGSMPFTPDPPAVYVAKVKNVLVGLPPTDTELQAITANPAQLGSYVDQWMQLPEYQTKMQRFFELAFQQTQITGKDISSNMIFPEQIDTNSGTSALMLQNVEESFARTMVDVMNSGQPFNKAAMTTTTFEMTTALKMLYAFQDAFQVGNQVGCGLGSGSDAFKAKYPSVQMYFTATPIPLADSVDAGSPNFMHWYDPDVADAGCPSDPVVVGVSGQHLYEFLHGDLRAATNGACTSYKAITRGPLQPTDFNDWKPTTISEPAPGQPTTWFWDLPTLRGSNQLVLSLPRVGFFTTMAFLANWQTNASNQMRVTTNQTFIVATGAQIDGTDTTTPSTTPGLDAAHAAPGTACYVCHQLLDPSRSIFASTFSWNFGKQPTSSFANQPGQFAFEGVIAPQKTMYDLGTNLSTHPLLAPGWAQKLCYYVNSEPCRTDDPAFQQIVSLFQSSNYSWNQLVKAVVTSPVTTHAASTPTVTTYGEVVAVARRDHLCALLNARLGFKDVCGLNATYSPVLPSTALAIIPSLPSDAYSRGSTAPVLPTAPTLFLRGGLENLCEAVAALVIDNNNPPPGVMTWSSSNPTKAVSDFVSILMAIPPSDPRNAGLQSLLNAHYTAAKAVTGMTATSALESTFTAACLSPSTVSIGM